MRSVMDSKDFHITTSQLMKLISLGGCVSHDQANEIIDLLSKSKVDYQKEISLINEMHVNSKEKEGFGNVIVNSLYTVISKWNDKNEGDQKNENDELKEMSEKQQKKREDD